MAEEAAPPHMSGFARDVVQRLPHFMEERKKWMFIACFCADGNSDLHWSDYGRIRLTFPAPGGGMPWLRLNSTNVECWYQQVIYDEGFQQDSISQALRAVSHAISQNTRGQNEGPWASAMVDVCARNIAQLSLGLAAGFKRSSFSGEREWRIVCSPLLGRNNSAPNLLDENFGANIKRSPRAHVRLQIHQPQSLFFPVLTPPVPFVDWRCKPDLVNAEEIGAINSALLANGRSDLLRN
jgi:hypothetical protein